jgi:hypothetical protein
MSKERCCGASLMWLACKHIHNNVLMKLNVAAQVIDPHTNQYLDRLKDEPLFLALAQKVSDHFTRIGDTKGLARAALRRTEHFYYKTDAVYDAMRKLAVAQQEAANAVQVCVLLN